MKYVDLERQYMAYKTEIDREIKSVLDDVSFINGPKIDELENDLKNFIGSGDVIACSSGTDALLLSLMVLGVKPGDEVLVPAFTFIATATMVKLLGAIPVFVDVDPISYTINVAELSGRITDKTVGIIPVSLFGQCADMESINKLAKQHNFWVIEDAAQSFGASRNGKLSCSISDIATTSFFPAKPLGGFGDGGAIFTKNKDFGNILSSIRNHGQEGRYNHIRLGINARMDTLQAAIIRVKLKYFEKEVIRRNEIAQQYSHQLKDYVKIPFISKGNRSSWAQYTITCQKRDDLREYLSERNIPTAVHYPKPLNKQPVFQSNTNVVCPVSENLSRTVLSLPMHPFLADKEIISITNAVREFYGK